jgi:hypothetical protein
MNSSIQTVDMLSCPSCGQSTLHPKRKEMGFHVCVNCSTAKPVVGITTVEGSGDHTYNDIIIMDQSKANSIARALAASKGRTLHIDSETDASAVSQSVKDVMISINEYSSDATFDPTKQTPKNEDVQNLVQGIDY